MKKIKIMLLTVIITISISMLWNSDSLNPILLIISPIITVILLIIYLIISALTREHKTDRERHLSFYKFVVGTIALLSLLITYLLEIFNILPHYDLTIPLVAFFFTLVLSILTAISHLKRF